MNGRARRHDASAPFDPREHLAERHAVFSALYRDRHYDIVKLCASILRDRTEAEDATEEAFTKVWRAMVDDRSEAESYPWLRTVARNHCFDVLRKKKHAQPTDHKALEAIGPAALGSDVSIVADVDAALVRESVRRVAPRHRSILSLRDGSEMTYQQIADHESVPVSVVESRLYRARQAVRREFLALAGPEGAFALIFFRFRSRWFDLQATSAQVANTTADRLGASGITRLGTVGGAVATTAVTAVTAVVAFGPVRIVTPAPLAKPTVITTPAPTPPAVSHPGLATTFQVTRQSLADHHGRHHTQRPIGGAPAVGGGGSGGTAPIGDAATTAGVADGGSTTPGALPTSALSVTAPTTATAGPASTPSSTGTSIGAASEPTKSSTAAAHAATIGGAVASGADASGSTWSSVTARPTRTSLATPPAKAASSIGATASPAARAVTATSIATSGSGVDTTTTKAKHDGTGARSAHSNVRGGSASSGPASTASVPQSPPAVAAIVTSSTETPTSPAPQAAAAGLSASVPSSPPTSNAAASPQPLPPPATPGVSPANPHNAGAGNAGPDGQSGKSPTQSQRWWSGARPR